LTRCFSTETAITSGPTGFAALLAAISARSGFRLIFARFGMAGR
jgi:hypothetical protein